MKNKHTDNSYFHETLPHREALKTKHYILISTIIIFLFTFPFILHTYAHTNEIVDLNRTDIVYEVSEDLSED